MKYESTGYCSSALFQQTGDIHIPRTREKKIKLNTPTLCYLCQQNRICDESRSTVYDYYFWFWTIQLNAVCVQIYASEHNKKKVDLTHEYRLQITSRLAEIVEKKIITWINKCKKKEEKNPFYTITIRIEYHDWFPFITILMRALKATNKHCMLMSMTRGIRC